MDMNPFLTRASILIVIERKKDKNPNKKIRFDKALHKSESCAQGEREELLSKSKQS